MKKLLSRLTMRRKCFNFIDKVNGRSVYDYVDKYNNEYMAHYPFYIWSLRVLKNK